MGGFQLDDHVTNRDTSGVAHRRSTIISYVKTALDIVDEHGQMTNADTFSRDLRNKATEVLCMLDVTLETVMLIKRYGLNTPYLLVVVMPCTRMLCINSRARSLKSTLTLCTKR